MFTQPIHASLFINGKFISADQEHQFPVINPATEEIVGYAPKAGSAEVDAAVEAARSAFESGVWSGLEPAARSAVLLKMAEGIRARREELQALLVQECGATLAKARNEVSTALRTLRYYAELIQQPYTYQSLAPEKDAAIYSYNFLNREPIGVCAGIVPWNFPLSLGLWKIAPALAAGNTMIIKPPSEAPLTLLQIAAIAQDAGLPDGVLNFITGSGRVVGEALASHPQVDKISFTGSTDVGKRVLELSSQSNLKITTLELGGKSANIILADADLDLAIDAALFGSMYNTGQVCESGTRLLVAPEIYSDVLQRLSRRIQDLRIGNPSDPATSIGPVISRRQQEKIYTYIQSGLDQGASLLAGGQHLTEPPFDKGFWVQPTLFANVNNSMKIAQEEIFGPVLSILPFETEQQAVEIANDSIYGLGGAVWSRDTRRAVALAKQLRTGTVWINTYHLLSPIAPFGGYKQSGLGRELGLEGLLSYTQTKHIHVDLEYDQGRRYQVLFPSSS